jgi:prepilin-type processing-associated H-X9-DG protein
MFIYASCNKGSLPINVLTPKPKYWYDADRLGRILSPSQPVYFLGGIAACPDDIGGVRSYSMNVWASSLADSFIATNGTGSFWRLNAPRADRLILVAEKWSAATAVGGWATATTLASTKDSPGRRFGGGVGIAIFSSVHFGQANCELPYQRHRTTRGQGRGTQPVGRVNIGYADGHVALKSNSDLVDTSSGLSTMDSWWSPMDFELNK